VIILHELRRNADLFKCLLVITLEEETAFITENFGLENKNTG
jgi:hypothetical protein